MKNFIVIIIALLFILPSNGCRILKNKKLERHSEQELVKNDIKASTLRVDSVVSANKYYFEKSNSTLKETISYKSAPDDDPIELTGTFKIDTSKSLKGDTALTLKGNGVELTITRNPKNNTLTANIKKGGKKQSIPFNEMVINREITNNNNITDSSKYKATMNKLEQDSIDRSKRESKSKSSQVVKSKDTKPTLGTFGIIVGVAIVLGFFLWLGFKK